MRLPARTTTDEDTMTPTDFDPAEIGHGMFYFFLTSVVVPRPIAWISTRSSEGVDNLAPHSFFTVSSVDPPIVQITSVGRKDSLNNIEQNGEFVVCLAPAYLMAEINATGTDFPLGLTPDGGHLTGGTAGPAGRMSACRASVASTPRSFGSRLPAW